MPKHPLDLQAVASAALGEPKSEWFGRVQVSVFCNLSRDLRGDVDACMQLRTSFEASQNAALVTQMQNLALAERARYILPRDLPFTPPAPVTDAAVSSQGFPAIDFDCSPFLAKGDCTSSQFSQFWAEPPHGADDPHKSDTEFQLDLIPDGSLEKPALPPSNICDLTDLGMLWPNPTIHSNSPNASEVGQTQNLVEDENHRANGPNGLSNPTANSSSCTIEENSENILNAFACAAAEKSPTPVTPVSVIVENSVANITEEQIARFPIENANTRSTQGILAPTNIPINGPTIRRQRSGTPFSSCSDSDDKTAAPFVRLEPRPPGMVATTRRPPIVWHLRPCGPVGMSTVIAASERDRRAEERRRKNRQAAARSNARAKQSLLKKQGELGKNKKRIAELEKLKEKKTEENMKLRAQVYGFSMPEISL